MSLMRQSRSAPPWKVGPRAVTPVQLRLAVLQFEPETGLGAFGGVLDAGRVRYDVLDAHRALLRREDLDSWRNLSGYRRLVDRNGEDWNGLAAALEQATPELDELGTGLLNRWLHLTAAVKTFRERRQLAA